MCFTKAGAREIPIVHHKMGGIFMDKINNMSNMYPEHRTVMDNFIGITYEKSKNTTCKIMREAKYHWEEDVEETREPDISIICTDRKRRKLVYTCVPRFIAEVLSDSTEKVDRGIKMDLYCKIGVEEYWIIDWRKRTIERYLLSDDCDRYILHDIINDDNKDELRILSFPIIDINFDELFDVSDY